MTQIDQTIADALAGSPETHVATLAREVVRLREAPTVVVPEIADDELRKMILSAARRKGCIDFDPEDVSDGDLEILREIRDDLAKLFHAIPADRVLGEGMVAVDARDLDSVISEIDECSKWPHLCENSDIHRHSPAGKRIRALRANHGGAEHD